jgi:trans-2,3-dihydro-3-hydroxyanthranilate isomerase
VLNRPKVDEFRTASGIAARGVYVFTTEPASDGGTSYSRLLGAPGALEDPATGSAAGPAASFMVKYGFVSPDRASSIVNIQGVLVKRPSRIHANIATSGGEISVVKIGGASVVIGDGVVASPIS